jgi:hypothetical protein
LIGSINDGFVGRTILFLVWGDFGIEISQGVSASLDVLSWFRWVVFDVFLVVLVVGVIVTWLL